MAKESGLRVKVDITEPDLVDLLSVFAKKAFDATTTEPGSLDALILHNCEYLMSLDYNVFQIDNTGGVFSAGYPPTIFVPESEHDHVAIVGDSSAHVSCNSNGTNGFESANSSDCNAKNRKPYRHTNGSNTRSITPTLENENSNGNSCDNYTGNGSDSDSSIQSFVTVSRPQRPPKQRTIYEEMYDANRIRDLITRARYARCRQRFVAPVIYFRGQYICRSATVSVVHETYSRYAYDYITSGSTNETQQRTHDEENPDSSDDSLVNDSPSPFSYSEVIRSDIALLNTLNIKTIADLMVEQRKIKFFITISSSEKADPEHSYKNFNLLALPYPGCEFFKKFREYNYMAPNLHYNWKNPFNNANISIPKIGPAMDLDINWEEYRNWDLVVITQNYLKAMLKYVQEENSGLLVHCISGWDRTPLFISLLRLSLWADGLIHQSLNYIQMTYFTLAYDWYLFGHQLPSREKRGEDIIVFCFHMLKFLTSEEFSLGEHRKRTKTTSSSGSCGLAPKMEDDAALREELFLAACDHDSNDSFSNNSNCDLQITDTLNAITIPNTSSQATTTNNTTIPNRSPNSKRTRTSPMPVPGANSARQRQESVSSNSSWHLVTETGSIDSVVAGSYMRNHAAQRSESGSVNSNSSTQSSKRSNGSTTKNSGSDTVDSSPSAHNSSGGSNISGTSFSSAVSSHSGGTNNTTLPTTIEGTASASNGEQAKSLSPKPSDDRFLTERERRLNNVRAIFVRAYGKGVGLKLREGSGINLGTFISTLF
ncbi:phosphatidylinositol-3,5-bisphosphate 3-phosphatase MTMR14 [Bactrocera oleae]|uniref:phosphatidylinositol-3,5-bisphosphate 3-phosphatase MTMR14 n=1 Tax=Bactrocera oleae TaxID=104688 RepID=UPI00387E714A